MVQDDGYAPHSENPLYGPPATTMVRYGAKQAALIKYRTEWWRIISSVMLHAGIVHIVSNVFIQVCCIFLFYLLEVSILCLYYYY
jgi:membrane associated rhomboid family serine protease